MKWEYDISLLNVSPKTQYDKLNERGEQGWELVCIIAEYAYFKRPKQFEQIVPDRTEAQWREGAL
jgi:hypothetical protein